LPQEVLVELEEKYDTDPSYLEYIMEGIQEVEALQKEKEERLKARTLNQPSRSQHGPENGDHVGSNT
jgi:hypothetical protein